MQVECAVGDVVIDFGLKHVEQLFALSLFVKRKAKRGHMPPQKAAVYQMPCFHPGLTGFH